MNNLTDEFDKVAVAAYRKNPVVFIQNPYSSNLVNRQDVASGANALLDIYQTKAERAAVMALAKLLGCEVDG